MTNGHPPVVMAPGRSIDQVLCELTASVEQLNQLLQMVVSGQVQLPVFAYPGTSTRFQVNPASIGTKPQLILPANRNRYSFLLMVPTATTLYVSSEQFDPAQRAPIRATTFGLDGHTGEVWVSSTGGTVQATVIEQVRGSAPLS